MNEKKSNTFLARVMADTNIYQVKLGRNDFQYGAQVVIKTEFGEDLAFITSFLFDAPKDNGKKFLKARFVRYATEEDKELGAIKLAESRMARKEIVETSLKLGLDMNITHVLLPLSGNGMAVYYTANDRVDFRELLKILRESFKEKIVMRQIGSKARMDSFALDVRIPQNKHRLSS